MPPDPTAGKSPEARLYFLYCEGCHGPDGKKGDPKRDLSKAKDLTDAEMRSIIQNEKGEMPPMKEYIKEEQITTIIQYVKQMSSPNAPPSGVSNPP